MEQLSIFDYINNENDNFETMSIERAAELVGMKLKMDFQKDERYFKNHYSAKENGFYVTIGFCINFEGKRILDTSIDYKTGCYGNPANSIQDCVDSVRKYMERNGK